MAVLGTQVIKSIQRGNVDLSGGATTSVTINAVDLTKSFSNVKTANGAQGGKANNTTSNYTSYGASIVAGGNLDSTTTLLVRAGSGLGSSSVVSSTCRVYWEVIEYV